MLELKTKSQLSKDAHTLAGAASLVRCRNVTYIPADFETLDYSVPPAPERTIWLPLNQEKIRVLAKDMFSTLFGAPSELTNFEFMVAQSAALDNRPVTSLLVRTDAGLRELDENGKLVPTEGDFRPNYLTPMLNEDQEEKDRVFDVVSGWLNSDEDAESLLRHLATCLAPGWSAVKYVLLLGDGRNGKSVLMKMVASLFGEGNVSQVTRQAIAEKSPVVTELNGKLVNVIYDGEAEYLKDSGMEKSIIAGESVPIRKLYDSAPTMVQTNALFIEGLQREPKTKDKSTALQKRLVRYQFPNVYALDHRFEKSMLTEDTLGAFLSLLVDRYVKEGELSIGLAPTSRAIELQLESMYTNSIALQFVKYLEDTDPFGANGLLGAPLSELVQKFQSWRVKENDLGTWAEPDVTGLFGPLLSTERKSARDAQGQPRKIRVITSYKEEAAAFISSLKGEAEDADIIAALVED